MPVRTVNCFSYFEASELRSCAGKEIQCTSGAESCPADQENVHMSLRLNYHSSLFETACLLLLLLLSVSSVELFWPIIVATTFPQNGGRGLHMGVVKFSCNPIQK